MEREMVPLDNVGLHFENQFLQNSTEKYKGRLQYGEVQIGDNNM